MDLMATRVTELQRKRWKKKNACTSCGSPDHWSKDCPSNDGSGGSSSRRDRDGKQRVQIRYIRAEPGEGLEEDDDGDDFDGEDY